MAELVKKSDNINVIEHLIILFSEQLVPLNSLLRWDNLIAILHIHIHTRTHIYIYIYTQRNKERERESDKILKINHFFFFGCFSGMCKKECARNARCMRGPTGISYCQCDDGFVGDGDSLCAKNKESAFQLQMGWYTLLSLLNFENLNQ